MFRRFARSSPTRALCTSTTSVKPTSSSPFSSLFLSSPTTSLSSSPLLVTSTSSITTNELLEQLQGFQSEYAISKNPILKRDAADVIEREVLTDLKKQNTKKTQQQAENEDDEEEELLNEQELAEAASLLLAPPPALEPNAVKTIITAAATFSVNLLEPCHAVTAALRWCVELPRIEANLTEEEKKQEYCVKYPLIGENSNNNIDNNSSSGKQEEKTYLLDPASSAKVLQSLIAMQHPHAMEVLVSWTHRIVELIPHADAPALVSLAHAYGRTGTIHQRLLAALEKRALEVLDGTKLIAQVANSFYAFSQLQSKNEQLYKLLSDRAVELLPQASPIVIATIIDSIATSGIPQPEVLDLYERLGATKVAEASPPLVASMLFGVVRCHNPESDRSEENAQKAADSPIVKAGCTRIEQISEKFDAASASKVLQALVIANVVDENILTQLADRITAIASACKLDECASILRAIAQFELYDDALFEALARRTMMLLKGSTRGGGGAGRVQQSHEISAAADQVASILCSFAMVSQPHSDLFTSCTYVIKHRANQLTSSELTDLMWSYVVLGEHLRHEPLFMAMQEELRRRERVANDFELDLIRKHPRYETAMQLIAQ